MLESVQKLLKSEVFATKHKNIRFDILWYKFKNRNKHLTVEILNSITF